MGRNIRYDILTGGLNTVSSLGTINQSTRRTESPEMYNVEWFKLGGIKSMEGNVQFGNTQTDTICVGMEYQKNQIKYMVIGTTAGDVKVYNAVSKEFDTIYTFPTATERMSMVAFNNGIVVTNGVDDLIFWEHGRNTLLTGSISGTIDTKTINGVSTIFETELHVGDYIVVGDNTYIVDEITSDTELKVTENLVETITSSSYNLGELSLCNATLVNEDDPSVSLPIRGLALQVYKGRLFVGGNDDNLYYSQLGLYNGWDIKYEAGSFPPFYNDTSNIYALGIYADYLLVHRRNYTYILAGEGTPDSWALQPFADISCESQQSFIATNNAYYVFSRKNGGIYPLLKRTIFSDRFVGDELSVKIRDTFADLNTAKLDEIYCVSSPQKRWICFYMPMLSGYKSNVAYIFDLQTNAWLVRIVPQHVTCAFRYNDRVYIGTEDGKVLEEYKGLTFDGYPINFMWKSPWFDFGDGSSFLSTREFRIQIAEDSNNDFFVRNSRDGLTDYTERRVRNKSGSKTALIWSDPDGLLTDTVWDDFEWVDTGFTTYRFPLANQYFQQMQISLCGTVADQGMAVYGFELHGIEREEQPWT